MRKKLLPLFVFVLMLGIGQTTSSSAVTKSTFTKVNMFLLPVSEWYLYGWEDGHYDYVQGNVYKTTFNSPASRDDAKEYQVGYVLGFDGGDRPVTE